MRYFIFKVKFGNGVVIAVSRKNYRYCKVFSVSVKLSVSSTSRSMSSFTPVMHKIGIFKS